MRVRRRTANATVPRPQIPADFGYGSVVTFAESDLAALATAEEVDIETLSPAGETHRTIIWTVERDGEVYARSYRGASGRWYREAMAVPMVTLHVDGRRIAALVVPALDPTSVAACSAGLREKYARSPSLRAMLVDDVLPTTIRLDPVPVAEAV